MLFAGRLRRIMDARRFEQQRHEGNNAREMWNAWHPTMECVQLWGAQTSASGAGYAARANADMRERGVKTIVVDLILRKRR